MMYRSSFSFKKLGLLVFLVTSCWLSNLAAADASQVIDFSKWAVSSTDHSGGTVRSGVIKVGHSKFKAVIEGTSKGNGVLLLKNLRLRVWDVHDDGAIYSGGWLEAEVVDKPRQAIVIYGVIVLKDDADQKGASPIYRSLVGVYEYDPKSDTFTKVYGNANWSYAEME